MININKTKDAHKTRLNKKSKILILISLFICCILLAGCESVYYKDRTKQIAAKFSSPCEYTAGFIINEMHGVMNIKFDGTDVMIISIQGESDICGMTKTIRDDIIITEYLGCKFETNAEGDIFSDLRKIFVYLGSVKYQSKSGEKKITEEGKSVRKYTFEPLPSGTKIHLSVDAENGNPVKIKYSASNGKDNIELNFS